MLIKLAVSPSKAFFAKTKSLVKILKNPEVAQHQLNSVRHFADLAHGERQHIQKLTSPLGKQLLESTGGPKDRLQSHLEDLRSAVKKFKGK